MKKINKYIDTNIVNIIKIFLLITPIIDILTSMQLHFTKVSLTIGIILKLLFIFVLAYHQLIIKKFNNTIVNSYILLMFIYSFIYIFIVNSISFTNLSGLFRVMFFPLSLILCYFILKEKSAKIDCKTICLLGNIYSIFLIIACLSNSSFNSYAVAKEGSVGWFNSANEISAILAITMPFIMYYIFHEFKITKVLYIIAPIITIFIIGTKTPLVSLFLCLIALIIKIIINFFKTKKYKRIILSFLVIILSITSLVIFIPKTNIYKNTVIHLNYLGIENVSELFDTKVIDHFIFGSRFAFLSETNDVYASSNISQKIIGIGFEKPEKLIEMDLFDLFYRTGVLGLMIVLIPLAIILREKNKYNKKYTIPLIMIIFSSFLAGHTITAPSVSLLVSLIICNMFDDKNKEIDTKLDSNEKANSKNMTIIHKISKLKLNKPKFNSWEVLVMVIMSIAFGLLIARLFIPSINSHNSSNEMNTVYQTLLDEYKDEVDPDKLSEAAIAGMLDYLEDEYSVYFNQEATSSFYEQLDGSFTGIGVTITSDLDGYVVITDVMDDSPAYKAGLKKGDRFLKVNDIEVKGLTTKELSDQIKGSTKDVSIVVERDNTEITLTLKTEKINIPSVTKETYESNNHLIGYIGLSIFAENTDEQFENALQELQSKQIDSLIIDVRGNPGGHLSTVNNILDLFLNKDQILYQLKNDDKVDKVYGHNTITIDIPIIVLINKNSASASELLASALKEAGHCDLVGETTFGKGTVQRTLPLTNGSMVKYTIEEWLTSDGNSINKVGVTPTIEVKLNKSYFNTYKSDDDNQLQTAILQLAKN